jgi:hypothetical protein
MDSRILEKQITLQASTEREIQARSAATLGLATFAIQCAAGIATPGWLVGVVAPTLKLTGKNMQEVVSARFDATWTQISLQKDLGYKDPFQGIKPFLL